MQRYFVELSFNGTSFHGWQVQPNSITVQGLLNNSLTLKIREPIITVGAGRTDAGVHADHFIAHFESERDDLDGDKHLVFEINGFLPHDIAIKRIFKVADTSHARFDALSRTYKYYIARSKNPFTYDYSYYLYKELDVDKMNEAAKLFLEYTDFTSFAKVHSDTKTNDCKVMEAFWEETEDKYIFTIKADRFLRNMVRSIVGTLIAVGNNKMDINEFKKVIEAKDRSVAGVSAPAKGLFLNYIEYPEQI